VIPRIYKSFVKIVIKGNLPMRENSGKMTTTIKMDGAEIILTLDVDYGYTIEDVILYLIKPALLAQGYHPDCIKDMLWENG
jgi:hypothetical protein